MDVKEAALKFGISRRRVEALCASGRIPGAKKKKGMWRIPSSAVKPVDERSSTVADADQISLFDVLAHDEKKTFDRKEARRALSIAPNTLKNWVRLGKIESEGDGLTFDKEYIKTLSRSRKRDPKKQRGSKRTAKTNTVFSGYIRNEANKKALATLAEAYPSPSPAELRALLAGCAVKLFREKNFVRDSRIPDIDRPTENEEFDRLVFDLLGEKGAGSSDAFRAGADAGFGYVPGEDTLGFVYISLCDLSRRKKTGRYFTPAAVTASLCDLTLEKADGTPYSVLDPCCGTGNFLIALAARGVPAAAMHGFDLDTLSVLLCRISLFLADGEQTYEDLCRRIVKKDSLSGQIGRKYALVAGNPPWGYAYTDAELDRLARKYASASKGGAESFDLFVEMGLRSLEDGGRLSFVVPEAILTVASHEAARSEIIKNASFSFVSYLGNVFSDVRCPAILLGLEKRRGGVAGCDVIRGGERFTIRQDRPLSTSGFSLRTDDAKWEMLGKIERLPGARFLRDRADFALGIVTGNNREFVSEGGESGEPVLRGSDVFKYRTREPLTRIIFEPQRFQQCAPEKIYRAEEKLVYRFICEEPVFAYDAAGTLSLNSCNVLIPRIRGLRTKYILAVLNSGVASFFLREKYGSVKLLRSHIESLPIPKADEEEQARIEALVDGILSGGDAAEAQKEIDQKIAALYGLTEEEKRTVFEGTKAAEKYLL